jgi:hypothetical protein
VGCGCRANSAGGTAEPYRLKLASGKIKSYSTQTGVLGAQANHPGSIILPRADGIVVAPTA